MTSPQMLEYYRKKEQRKVEIEREKEERKRAREMKKMERNTKKIKKKRRKIENKDSSCDSDSNDLSFNESDASEWEEKSDIEEEVIEVSSIKELKEGDFIIVQYKGGKRMVTTFTYLCIIQQIISPEEIEIMGLRSADFLKKIFTVKEKDVSVISLKQVVGKVKEPQMVVTGERVSYQIGRAHV